MTLWQDPPAETCLRSDGETGAWHGVTPGLLVFVTQLLRPRPQSDLSSLWLARSSQYRPAIGHTAPICGYYTPGHRAIITHATEWRKWCLEKILFREKTFLVSFFARSIISNELQLKGSQKDDNNDEWRQDQKKVWILFSHKSPDGEESWTRIKKKKNA